MINATSMFSGAATAVSDPFHPSSIFKDPSAAGRGQLTDLHAGLSTLSGSAGLDGGLKSQLDSTLPMLNGFESMIKTNTADRVKSIHADLQSVMAVKNIRDTVSSADGGGITLDCSFVDDIFGSVTSIGAVISDTMGKIQTALSSVLSTIGNVFSAGMTAITGAAMVALNAAKTAISAALASVQSFISDAMSSLQGIIDAEKAKLAAFMDELLSFGFLKSLPHLSVCGQDLMGNVLDSSKVDMSTLAKI